MRVDTHPDPVIMEPTDAIIKITSTAICGSDLHLYDNYVPMMKEGDIIGHEPMGIVVETGSAVKKIKKGDRVVVSFTISCGHCFFCDNSMYSLCDNTNPKKENAAKAMGHSPAGIYGYSHLTGGIPGGQAEFLRVPHADLGTIKIESDLPDEKVLFLSDIFPTGYMAAVQAQIEPGDTVAVWGCGPVGQFAIQSAWMLGAERVIAIDKVEERLELAQVKRDDQLRYWKNCWPCAQTAASSRRVIPLSRPLHMQSDQPHALNQALAVRVEQSPASTPAR